MNTFKLVIKLGLTVITFTAAINCSHMLAARDSEAEGLAARWRAWYHLKLRPCLRRCPSVQRFTCGYDPGRQRYAVASSSCALARRNACFDQDFQEVPIEDCLNQLKFRHEDSKFTIPDESNKPHV